MLPMLHAGSALQHVPHGFCYVSNSWLVPIPLLSPSFLTPKPLVNTQSPEPPVPQTHKGIPSLICKMSTGIVLNLLIVSLVVCCCMHHSQVIGWLSKPSEIVDQYKEGLLQLLIYLDNSNTNRAHFLVTFPPLTLEVPLLDHVAIHFEIWKKH